jgi:hypothetical protein
VQRLPGGGAPVQPSRLEAGVSERLGVFGYGSLVSPASAAETLGRPVGPLRPGRLRGWRRRWSIARDNFRAEKTFARADDRSLPPFFVSLNLERMAGPGPNGAVIEVTKAELERLDLREIRYDRIEVSDSLEDPDFDRVFAYVAKPGHRHPTPPAGALAIAGYVREVEAAFSGLGAGQLQLYRETTEACPVQVVEVVLVRDSIPVGNPRGW